MNVGQAESDACARRQRRTDSRTTSRGSAIPATASTTLRGPVRRWRRYLCRRSAVDLLPRRRQLRQSVHGIIVKGFDATPPSCGASAASALQRPAGGPDDDGDGIADVRRVPDGRGSRSAFPPHDFDGDGIANDCDNCPLDASDQNDGDQDVGARATTASSRRTPTSPTSTTTISAMPATSTTTATAASTSDSTRRRRDRHRELPA